MQPVPAHHSISATARSDRNLSIRLRLVTGWILLASSDCVDDLLALCRERVIRVTANPASSHAAVRTARRIRDIPSLLFLRAACFALASLARRAGLFFVIRASRGAPDCCRF